MGDCNSIYLILIKHQHALINSMNCMIYNVVGIFELPGIFIGFRNILLFSTSRTECA